METGKGKWGKSKGEGAGENGKGKEEMRMLHRIPNKCLDLN